jgi:hypothetical protein
MGLLDDRSSGWRQFASRPETISWVRLRRHIDAMAGAALVDVACDRMNEAALIFTYRGHRFGLDLQDGAFRFTVEDPNCPDDILREVIAHLR